MRKNAVTWVTGVIYRVTGIARSPPVFFFKKTTKCTYIGFWSPLSLDMVGSVVSFMLLLLLLLLFL